MRKLLLATTALAGAAFLAGAAQANQGLEVTIGGYDDFQAGFFGDHQRPRTPNASQIFYGVAPPAQTHDDFRDEFQLDIEAKAKTSNGLEYGAVASLWNGDSSSTAITTHQAYGYLNGAWGQVRAGDHHGVSDFYVSAPMTYNSGAQVDGYYTEFLPSGINAIRPHFLENDDNSTKVTYMTPKLGFANQKIQLGVSYAPNAGINSANANSGNQVTTQAGTYGQIKNEIIAGAQYEGSFANKIKLLSGFVLTNGEKNGSLVDPTGTFDGMTRDFTAWDAGAQLGYAGFTVGGNYTDAGSFAAAQGQTRDQHAWSAGASYKFDRASFAGSYLKARGYGNQAFGSAGTNVAITSPTSDFASYEAYGVGAGYSLFDGMTTSVDAVFFKQERLDTGERDEGHVIILSNRVAF